MIANPKEIGKKKYCMLMKPQEDQETKDKGVSSAVEQWLVQKVHLCTGHHLLNTVSVFVFLNHTSALSF